ncbi:PhoH family protein [Parasphaerochaeta coccoides]|uniref:PhoH-like protein n=1 Tax=Parasphaerochaeta coccoides (strain ATCC BAA-1237 / DSM 17374 / SPN1) TaxID=760011 RepID=F4GII7_PARC1|nr:PhoH family protein [Parasphaerochaeta coccoides]AEC01695.1 PhoH family protein [Parasphaerochaeta coccoides DSM 17374]
MGRSVVFEAQEQMRRVLGANDRNLPYLEALLGTDLTSRGNALEAAGNDERGDDRFVKLLQRLKFLADRQPVIAEPEIFMEYQILVSGDGDSLVGEIPAKGASEADISRSIVIAGHQVFPKSLRQKEYIRAMQRSQVVFGIGPAGTGKTFLAVAHALELVLTGVRSKLIISRPVVEAGESLGFLPGDLSQKLDPYLKPLHDAMERLVPRATLTRMYENNVIEVAPLAYMRGRSLHNVSVILDEAQNTTQEQMKMFLTRLGDDANAVITGDITQTDLPRGKESGLVHASRILKDIEGIEFIYFSSPDIVRSRIVQRIVSAYDHDSGSAVTNGRGDVDRRFIQ